MKRFLKFVFYTVVSIVVVFCGYVVATGKYWMFKEVRYNFADIDDYRIFSNNVVATGSAQPWPVSVGYNKPAMPDSLSRLMEDLQSVAVLVIRNDSLLFEKYWDGYSDSAYSGSFSVAKSITSMLIGAALKEGKIKSLQEPIGNYLPEFASGQKSKVRVIDLLTMSSGSDWDESYANPFSVTAELYYGDDVYKTATGVKIIREPGSSFGYKSGDSQLLGLMLEKATGKTLSEYASEKIWKPVGAIHPALWSLDRPGGNEKSYGCFNSNARDFARIGQLMLDSGRWNATEVISPEYYLQSIAPCNIPDESGQRCDYYGFQWWLAPHQPGVFYARGILGQYIVVLPKQRMVIVRLGKKRSPKRIGHNVPEEVEDLINWGKQLL